MAVFETVSAAAVVVTIVLMPVAVTVPPPVKLTPVPDVFVMAMSLIVNVPILTAPLMAVPVVLLNAKPWS